MTLGEVLRHAAEHLAPISKTPRLDAELLLAHALGISRVELYTAFDRPLTEHERDGYRALIARRARHEPVAYLLGEWGFRRLTLTVDRRALIPRPETEIVVERCLALLDGRPSPHVLDVGTGTGAIALAIADEHPGARVVGTDASPDALELARRNRERTGIDVELCRHDALSGLPAGPWALVVSNPPYVEPEEIDTLMPDVRDWEPHTALVGHGVTEAVARGAAATLEPGGALVLEVAEHGAAAATGLLASLGFEDVCTTKDLSGRDRVVEGIRP